MKKVKILDVPFDVVTRDETLARVLEALYQRNPKRAHHIVTPNPEMILLAQENPAFRNVLNHAWLSIPDGVGILWAATFQNMAQRNKSFLFRSIKGAISLAGVLLVPKFIQKIFPERVTGTDLMESICSVIRHSETPVFLLGAEPSIAEKVKNILEKRYHGMTVVGTYAGSPRDEDFLPIQAVILETQPEVLFVAYGSPFQELWIAKHLKELPSVKIAMGVGGAFNFLAGVRKRAPLWMQRAGLEWLFRLLQEPSRMKRIWNAVVKFPYTVIKSA